MGLDFTVTAALARVHRKLQLRTDNAKLTEAEMMQVMDEEIQQRLFPALCRVVEDYGVEWISLTIPAGAFRVRLPGACTSDTVQSVRYVRSDGREFEIPRTTLNELPTMSNGAYQSGSESYRYAFDSVNICVFPQPVNAITLRILYTRRPSRLVTQSSCVAAIAQNMPYVITVGAAPGSFVQFQVVDAVSGSPPLGLYETCIISSYTGTTFTLGGLDPFGTNPKNLTGFASPTVSGVDGLGLSNDWLCPSGYTCVFPLPEAWYAAWIESSAATIAEELGRAEKAATLRATADATIATLMQHQANRARSQPIPVFNKQSGLRRNARTQGYGGYR